MSSHSASDSGMQKMMIMVGIALCVITLLIMLTARILSSGSNDEFDQLLHNAQMKRIEPVGQVRTSLPETAQAAIAAPAAPRSGEELANGACAACHSAGVAGAPSFADQAAWDQRATVGLEALVASVVNGKGGMPAGGGSDYSEAEITRAVEFMTGLGNGGEVAEAPVAAETETAEVSEAVSTESDSAEAEVESDSVNAEAATAESEGSEQTAVVADAPETTNEGVVAALTSRIETTVDEGVCAGCHDTGVAGAPKYSDKAEWAKRAEAGYAHLAETVRNGKGAMPPRGGSDLTDDELLIAVEYIVQKSL